MDKEILDENITRVGWGLLAILWGATILCDFLPLGSGLVGTGLILLTANIARWHHQLPRRADNTILGILFLGWGSLELARPWLGRLFPSADLDWVIFAILLIGWGLIRLVRAMLAGRARSFGALAGAREE